MKTVAGIAESISEVIIGRITHIDERGGRTVAAAVGPDSANDEAVYLYGAGDQDQPRQTKKPRIVNISDIAVLRRNDIVAVSPQGTVTILYSRDSNDNALLVTEKCNSSCIICPQVPPAFPTRSLLEDNKRIISLIPKETEVIGLTGGEPTVVPDELVEIISQCKSSLPDTRLEVLTNSIALEDVGLVRRILAVKHARMSFHIPLYSDAEGIHNRIVGTSSFYRTINGLYNLARYEQQIEIRTVVTALNFRRLRQWAAFVVRNFPFVCHVAIMGLEPTGDALANFSEVWIEPHETIDELAQAIRMLARAAVDVSVYNYQLCILPESIWKYSCRAISDWKNIFLPICQGCDLIDRCGGFFESQVKYHSGYIHPVKIGGAR